MKKMIFTLTPENQPTRCSDDITEVLEELKNLLTKGFSVTVSTKEMEESEFNDLPECPA